MIQCGRPTVRTPRFLGLCTTSPIGLFPFTFILSPFLRITKRRRRSQLARPSHRSLPLAPCSSSPAATTSASSALGPSLASVMPDCAARVTPIARPCPHHRSRRRCPHHLLLWLETVRALWPSRTSRLHRSSARPGAPAEEARGSEACGALRSATSQP
jgi:hypothetical protein